MPRQQILSTHPFRRSARKREHELQAFLDSGRSCPTPQSDALGILNELPWAQGVATVKAGRFSWAVIATEHKGH